MYYSSGNYEAFARPKKPAGVDGKSAYIIGSGLAALSAACILVRDGQMKGGNIHILEKDPIPGGACDGYKYENLGYVMRGGREMFKQCEIHTASWLCGGDSAYEKKLLLLFTLVVSLSSAFTAELSMDFLAVRSTETNIYSDPLPKNAPNSFLLGVIKNQDILQPHIFPKTDTPAVT